jgi:thioredoxin-related protein
MTMMKTLFTVLLLVTIRCAAQDSSAINFENDISWQETKEKAKKTNKIIFLDAYTTWCGPCKEMEANIFPQKKVFSFFNDHFINFKIQIDKTPQDSERVKNRYNDAKQIEGTYDITSYPTYLFINGDGIVVHFIVGGTADAEEFITKAKAALDPNTQYIKLQAQYKAGSRDTIFLKNLINVADAVNDQVNRPQYVQTFLRTETDLLTKRNILFAAQSVRSSSDIGFDVLTMHKEEVIPIIGARWRNSIISLVAFDELVLPIVRRNGKKEISDGGMYSYVGEIEKVVDWNAISKMLQRKCGADASRIFVDAQTTYYRWDSDWKNVNNSLNRYVLNAKTIDLDFLCNWMQFYVSNVKNTKELLTANKWISVAASQKDFGCSKPYGTYLFNIGKFNKAQKVLSAYQASLKTPDKAVTKLIEEIQSKK